MSKEAVQLTLPGFEQAQGRWRADYNDQIGTDRVVRNRSRIEIKPIYTPRDWNGDAFLETSASPANTRSPAAFIRPCIAAAPGRSAS